MSSDSSDDGEGGELGGLFTRVDDTEFAFYFSSISIQATEGATKVIFEYNYNRGKPIRSSMLISGELDRSHKTCVLAIGMCVLPWYWMGFGTKRIILEVEGVTDEIMSFFSIMYANVLLEFCERNNVEVPTIAMSEKSRAAVGTAAGAVDVDSCHCKSGAEEESILVPLGGGKDSLVSLDMAMEAGASAHLLHVIDDHSFYESDWRLKGIIGLLGESIPLHLVRHSFTDTTFSQTSRSFLVPTGHPWAALVIFDSLLVAQMNGIEKVFFGFEKSADYGNSTFWNGKEINHQYDKSSAFLRIVTDFIRNEMCSPVGILSPLSDMWDIEVAKIFCEKPTLTKFHPLFLSCNETHGTHSWCCKCEKCAFLYLILSAFLEPSRVQDIFCGCNMLMESNLAPSFLSLLGGGNDGKKPYECIGTFSESSAAVELAVLQWKLFEYYDWASKGESIDFSSKGIYPVNLSNMAAFIGLDKHTATDLKAAIRSRSKAEEIELMLSNASKIIAKWTINDA